MLLEKLGVCGTLSERMETAEDFGGHALALNLLGRYLAVVHDGEINKRKLIPRLTEEEEKGGHASRVMESYETWLAGMPELSILNLMGLFDRSAPVGAIDTLTDGKAIPGLTNALQNMPPKDWKYALRSLRDLKLLSEKGVGDPDALDCHPLVREHFREKLKNNNPEAWKEAHARLYDYYRNLPQDNLPRTREEMEPLFVAVAHGCMAGMHQETLHNVYVERIRRGRERYSVYKLGAFTSDLTALAGFFDKLWDKPVKSLTDKDKADLLDWVGFRHRALGQLEESIEPLKAASEFFEKQERFKGASVCAGNLMDVHLMLGDFEQAREYGKQGVRYAEQCEQPEQILSANAGLADFFLFSGELYESEKILASTEYLLNRGKKNYIYYMWEFSYYDFLLGAGKCKKVLQKAKATLEELEEKKWPLHIGLAHLFMGRAFLLEVEKNKTGDLKAAEEHMYQAEKELRKANRKDHLPRGLLACAGLYRLGKERQKAWNYLEEVWEIADLSDMKLYLADYYLETARLMCAQLLSSDFDGRVIENGGILVLNREDMFARLKDYFKTAKSMVDDMGYHRRDGELEDLASTLANL